LQYVFAVNRIPIIKLKQPVMKKLKTVFTGIIVFFVYCTTLLAVLPDGIVVYSDGDGLKNAYPLKYVEIKDGNIGTPKTLCSQKGRNSRISPDGQYVAFDDDNNGLYICKIQENATPVKLGDGSHPYWVKKNNEWYLFYSDRTCKCSFGTGKSFLRKVDRVSASWSGSANEVKYNGQSSIMKGGMGVNGKYACTGYPDCTIAEADATLVYTVSGGQKCNPSIAPTSNKMMILDDTGHQTIATYTTSGSRWSWKPGGNVQNPEWSTHEDYCAFVAGDHSGGDVYIGDMKNKKKHKIVDGGFICPHL
jgi:hypothetical protein